MAVVPMENTRLYLIQEEGEGNYISHPPVYAVKYEMSARGTLISVAPPPPLPEGNLVNLVHVTFTKLPVRSGT